MSVRSRERASRGQLARRVTQAGSRLDDNAPYLEPSGKKKVPLPNSTSPASSASGSGSGSGSGAFLGAIVPAGAVCSGALVPQRSLWAVAQESLTRRQRLWWLMFATCGGLRRGMKAVWERGAGVPVQHRAGDDESSGPSPGCESYAVKDASPATTIACAAAATRLGLFNAIEGHACYATRKVAAQRDLRGRRRHSPAPTRR